MLYLAQKFYVSLKAKYSKWLLVTFEPFQKKEYKKGWFIFAAIIPKIAPQT